MPSEWPLVRVEDIAEKIGMGPFGSAIKVDTFVDEGIPVISGQHLHGMSITEDSFNHVTEEHAEKLKNANVYRGDVVFTHAGTIGQVAYIPQNSRFARYIISQRQFYLRCNRDKVLPQFVVYYFRSPEGRHKLLANASQVGVPSIARPTTNLRAIEIPLPTLGEQQRIIDVIEGLEDKIALLRETNTTLEAIAQALFKSWFVDFDPVRAKAEGREPEGVPPEVADLFPSEFEDSVLGEIPKGWRIGKLEDLLVLQRGFDLPAQARTPGEFPIIAASGPCGTHVEAMAKGPGVVTGRSGVLGKVFLELENYWPLNTTLWVKEFKAATPCYAFEVLKRLDFQSYNAGSAVPTLNRNHVHGLAYVIPNRECVLAYEDIAIMLHQRVRANDKLAHDLSTLRDALLPRLMSGKLHIPHEAVAQ